MSFHPSTRFALNAVASSSKRMFSARPPLDSSSSSSTRRPLSSPQPTTSYGFDHPAPRPSQRPKPVSYGLDARAQSARTHPSRFPSSSSSRPPSSPVAPSPPPPPPPRIPLNFKFTSLTTDHMLAFNLTVRRQLPSSKYALLSPLEQQRHTLIKTHLIQAARLGLEARTKFFEELDAYDAETIAVEQTRKARLREEVVKGTHATKDAMTMEEWDARSQGFVEKSLEGKKGKHRDLAEKNVRRKEARFRRETVERREIMREMKEEERREKGVEEMMKGMMIGKEEKEEVVLVEELKPE